MKQFTPTKEAYKLFHESSIVLSQIEANGIRVDMDYLRRTKESILVQVDTIQKELKTDPIFRIWKRRFGDKTNLTSHTQLGEVIFDELGHKRPISIKKKDRKTNKASADEATFADISLPFVKEWFRMMKLDKAVSTYLKGITQEVVDGFLYNNFNLNRAVSYRSTSDQINFQNIPVRNPEIAKLVRTCFISRDGFVLGEIDFGGIEVRSACCYTEDPRLISEFTTDGKDPHGDTAMQIFMLEKHQVDKKGPRDAAKNMFVFPEFFGATWFQQAPEIWAAMHRRKFIIKDTDILVKDHLAKKGITKLGDCDPKATPAPGTFAHHLKKIEEGFWNERFKVYTEWKRQWWKRYQKDGGFRFLTGFCCSGILKRNQVLNYAIQGTAFHWLLWTLTTLQRWLNKNKMKTKIVGQIHDSIVADIYLPEKDKFLAKCKHIITVELPKHWEWIIVPLAVEMDVAPPGGSWFDKVGVKV